MISVYVFHHEYQLGFHVKSSEQMSFLPDLGNSALKKTIDSFFFFKKRHGSARKNEVKRGR